MTARRRGMRRSSRVVVRRRRLAARRRVALRWHHRGRGGVRAPSASDGGGRRPRATGAGAVGGRPRSRLGGQEAAAPRFRPRISGEAAVPYRGELLVLGGLDAADESASGVFRLDPQTGGLAPASDPAQPGSRCSRRNGRSPSLGPRAAAQAPAPTPSRPSAPAARPGSWASFRPHARIWPPSRSVARSRSIGGYDGRTPSADVLRTSDGRSFTTAARLPVPVRYPAVATAGSTIYAFGGETATRPSDRRDPGDRRGDRPGVASSGTCRSPLAHASAISLGGRDLRSGRHHAAGQPSARMLRFDPSERTRRSAGRLPTPVTNAAAATLGDTGYLVGGIGPGGSPLTLRGRDQAQARRLHPGGAGRSRPASARVGCSVSGPPPDRRSRQQPIARRQRPQADPLALPGLPANSRREGSTSPTTRSSSDHGRGIISNEEENEAIVELGYPSGKVIRIVRASRGDRIEPGLLPRARRRLPAARRNRHSRRRAELPGRLPGPGRRTSQIGTTGNCTHDPPRSLGSPNGDTPLANGDILVSEVNGSYVDEFTRGGHLVWSTHLPIAYPSDPQQLGPNRYLVADYTRPGGIYEFNRGGPHPLVVPPSLGARDARPPQPRRASSPGA